MFTVDEDFGEDAVTPDAPSPHHSSQQLEVRRPLRSVGSTPGSFLLPSVTGIQSSQGFAEGGGGSFKGTGVWGAFVRAFSSSE